MGSEELTNKNIRGWVYMVSPSMAVVYCNKDLDSLKALNMLV